VDLFEPGSDSRIHDFTGGTLPSGLVWTVPLPDESVVVSPDGKRLDVDVRDVAVIDTTSQGDIPAVVSFRITWKGRGKARSLGRGTAVEPTDAAAFLGQFRRARARGTFSGAAGDFTFQSSLKRKARSVWAELGVQQNGALLAGATRCDSCGRIPPDGPLRSPW
jgi:hypothetical protein